MLKVFLATMIALNFAAVELAKATDEPGKFAGKSREYGLHLFFNETEFVDVLTITPSASGSLRGHMIVPNDFEGDVTGLKITDDTVEFDLFIPKNSARPVDLVFHYQGRFFDTSQKQITGYVTIQGSKQFTASFVAFERGV